MEKPIVSEKPKSRTKGGAPRKKREVKPKPSGATSKVRQKLLAFCSFNFAFNLLRLVN